MRSGCTLSVSLLWSFVFVLKERLLPSAGSLLKNPQWPELGRGQSWELGIPSSCPLWVASTQWLELLLLPPKAGSRSHESEPGIKHMHSSVRCGHLNARPNAQYLGVPFSFTCLSACVYNSELWNSCPFVTRLAFFQVIFLPSRKSSSLSLWKFVEALWEPTQTRVSILPSLSVSMYTSYDYTSSNLPYYPVFVTGKYIIHFNKFHASLF